MKDTRLCFFVSEPVKSREQHLLKVCSAKCTHSTPERGAISIFGVFRVKCGRGLSQRADHDSMSFHSTVGETLLNTHTHTHNSYDTPHPSRITTSSYPIKPARRGGVLRLQSLCFPAVKGDESSRHLLALSPSCLDVPSHLRQLLRAHVVRRQSGAGMRGCRGLALYQECR